MRVKIGVGANQKDGIWQTMCLAVFHPGTGKLVDEAIEFAADAVEKIITDGPDAAMNEYNRKRVTE